MLSDEYRYKILKRLESDPDVSQRTLAAELGISVGKVNYCLKALMHRGLVKANNFRNNENKRAYLYFLTPKGIEEKSKVTFRFLKYKIAEYEALKDEIEDLKREVTKGSSNRGRLNP
jgi:EPS-associated MarR family transcriptional regulator